VEKAGVEYEMDENATQESGASYIENMMSPGFSREQAVDNYQFEQLRISASNNNAMNPSNQSHTVVNQMSSDGNYILPLSQQHTYSDYNQPFRNNSNNYPNGIDSHSHGSIDSRIEREHFLESPPLANKVINFRITICYIIAIFNYLHMCLHDDALPSTN